MSSGLKSLSEETERKLAEIFAKISFFETEIESSRYTLSKHRDFDPYSAFKSLDSLNLGSLSSNEFQSLLSKHHIFCTNDEAYLLVRQYDSSHKGRLSFPEFSNLVLPSTSPGLRDLSLSRQGEFTVEVEHLLSRLIEQEISYHRNLEVLRREIIIQNDFNLLDAFQAIDFNNTSLIDRNSLLGFLRNFFNLFDHDIDAILRRLDNDGDGLLNYNEFVDSVVPSRKFVETNEIIPVYQEPDRKNKKFSPVKYSDRAICSVSPGKNIEKCKSSRGTSVRQTSVETSHLSKSFREPAFGYLRERLNSGRNSERKINVKTNPFQSKTFAQSFAKFSPFKDCGERLQGSLNSNSAGLQSIIPALQDYIKITRQLESVKNSLALRHDFNLADAFKLFDCYDLGIISSSDIASTLSALSFLVQTEHLVLLIKNYSKIQDNRLRFNDFCDMLTPKTEEYSRILRSRSSRAGNLTKETLSVFLNAFGLLVDLEVTSEKHRQSLCEKPLFNCLDTFNTLDRDRKGYVSQMDFSELFKELGMPYNLRDLQAVMQKFDKNNDGRISYNEFVEELTSKSKLTY